jgi:hypothetical protein
MAVLGKMADRDRFRAQEIQDKIRRVLMDEWDPIGINDVPEAADEYDRYLGGIYGLIQRDAPEHQISEHLRGLETDEMGMVDAPGLPLFPTEKRDQVAYSLR